MMKNFKVVKEGDRVRAVYEFTAALIVNEGKSIRSSGDAWHDCGGLVSVEILPPAVKVGDWCMVRDSDSDSWVGPFKIGAIKDRQDYPFQDVGSGRYWGYAKPVSPELSAMLRKEFPA
jgi:hypothetical protein